MNVECSCLLKVMSLFFYFSTEVPLMFNINIGSIPFNKSLGNEYEATKTYNALGNGCSHNGFVASGDWN